MTRLLLNRDLLKLTGVTLLKPIVILGLMHIMNLFWDVENFHPVVNAIITILVAVGTAYVFIAIPVLFPEKFADLEDGGLLILVPLTTSSFVATGALLLLVVQSVFKYIKGILLIAIAIILSVYTGIYLLMFFVSVKSKIKKGQCREKTMNRINDIYDKLCDKELDFSFVDKLVDKFNKIKCV